MVYIFQLYDSTLLQLPCLAYIHEIEAVASDPHMSGTEKKLFIVI